jgi:hypothetical protein
MIGRGRKGVKLREYPVTPPEAIPPECLLRTATKQAQIWGRIIDALPDDELKELALQEYKKLGEVQR